MAETHRRASDARLAPLERADARAFAPSSSDEAGVCAFLLALAVLHNDLRDLALTARAIDAQPLNPRGEAGERERLGRKLHFTRLELGVLAEALRLVRDDDRGERAQEHPLFRRTLARVRASDREEWERLTRAARGLEHDGASGALLSALAADGAPRVADPAALAQWGRREGEPAAARGKDLAGTRHFFADDAARALVERWTAHHRVSAEDAWTLAVALERALHGLVTRFVEVRGYAWRKAA